METLAALRAYRKRLKAQLDRVDQVLAYYDDKVSEAKTSKGKKAAKIASVPTVPRHPRAVPDLEIDIRKRVRGVLAAVREIVQEFQGPFDKNDVMAQLKVRDPDL